MKDTNAVAQTNFSLPGGGWVAFSTEPKESIQFTLSPSNMWVSALRLEVVTRPPEEGETKSKKRKGSSITLAATIKSDQSRPEEKLSFYHAEADHKEERYANGYSIIGVKDRWLLSKEDERQTAVWLLDKPVQMKAGDSLIVDLGSLGIASARLSLSPFAGVEPLEAGIGRPLENALSRTLLPRSKSERDLEFQTYVLSSDCDADTLNRFRKLADEIRECRGGRAMVLVTTAQEPLLTRVAAGQLAG